MSRLVMSSEKYDYIVENIDFLDSMLTEQLRNNSEVKIQPMEMAEFLTKSIFFEDKDGTWDIDEREETIQTEFRKNLEELKENLREFEKGTYEDKVERFFNHLIGSLDPKNEECIRMLPILLEYVEYHKACQNKDVKKR